MDVLLGGNEIIRLWASKGKQQLQLSVVTAQRSGRLLLLKVSPLQGNDV